MWFRSRNTGSKKNVYNYEMRGNIFSNYVPSWSFYNVAWSVTLVTIRSILNRACSKHAVFKAGAAIF